ncbi:Methylmalonyl-CoA mutase large subunit [compost metagenome]
MEALTSEIEAGVERYFAEIEAKGGVLRCVEDGFFQQEIHESAYRYQRQVENNERVVVGVNRFQVQDEAPMPIQRIDLSVERSQQERLAARKVERDNPAVAEALSALEKAAAGEENLLPFILRAVKTYATVGEISDVLRKAFGAYRATVKM